jgi:hypothetical protein
VIQTENARTSARKREHRVVAATGATTVLNGFDDGTTGSS